MNGTSPLVPVWHNRSTVVKLAVSRPCVASRASINALPNLSGSESANRMDSFRQEAGLTVSGKSARRRSFGRRTLEHVSGWRRGGCARGGASPAGARRSCRRTGSDGGGLQTRIFSTRCGGACAATIFAVLGIAGCLVGDSGRAGGNGRPRHDRVAGPVAGVRDRLCGGLRADEGGPLFGGACGRQAGGLEETR
jgi:hypothetical protein